MHIENRSSSRRVSLSKHKQRFIQMIFVVGNGPVGGQYSNPSSRADSDSKLLTEDLTCCLGEKRQNTEINVQTSKVIGLKQKAKV